jgi:hypothetical protein
MTPRLAEVTLGTKDERKAKMQAPQMRRRRKEQWDSGIRPTTVVPRSLSIRSGRP